MVEEITSYQIASDSPPTYRPHSAGPSNSVPVYSGQQGRLQQLVTVPEYYSHSHSNSNSSTAASTPTSASSMTSNFIRTLPRTSSTDSTLSNASTIVHGQSYSQSSGSLPQTYSQSSGSSPQDILKLIEASGSPEAVIQVLLKDKASAQSQNTQLWRLVDKQRAMILGLNKDLERALKDKEKYRKKLKEYLAMFPHLQNDRATTESPAPSEQAEGHSPQDATYPEDGIHKMPRDRHGSIELDVVPYPVTPPIAQDKFDGSSDDGVAKMPSPIPHINSIIPPTPSDPSAIMSNEQSLQPPQDFSAALKSPRREIVRLNVDTNGKARHKTTQDSSHLTNPLSSISDNITPISATPVSATSVVPAERQPPKKKGPPARLDLSPTERMPFQATRGSDNDESNYDDDDDDDDDVSIEEISGYEQRRKELEKVMDDKKVALREDDGREKTEESLVQKRSTQLSESSDAPLKDAVPSNPEPVYERVDDKKAGISEPLALKALGPRPTPLSLSKLREAYDPESLGLGLSPMFPPGHGMQRENIVTTRLNATRPMSPGLPSSPRPSPNSPLPRPRKNVSSPEPLSPRSTSKFPGSALPASPRVGQIPASFHTHGSPSTPSQASFAAAATGLGLVPLSPNPYSQEWSSRHGSNTSSSPVTDLLIEPSAIATVEIRVVSSRMRPSRSSFLPGKAKAADDSVFTLGVFSRVTGRENWRVEKDIGALPTLDSRLRHYNKDLTAKLPDRTLFVGHAPAKVDARRAAIEEYFAAVMELHMDEQLAQALCEFLSTDVVEAPFQEAQSAKEGRNSPDGSLHGKITKEGYLTKRGKNFGGWKARYFVLDGPVLRYFESPGGTHLGSIKLSGAQIGRQQQPKESHPPKEGDGDSETENQFRHAFLIMEPKRKDSGSLVRHVLCAESDAERDEWVDALMVWVNKGSEETKLQKAESIGSIGKRKKERKDREEEAQEELRAYRYDDVAPGAAPARGPTPDGQRYRSPTPTSNSNNSSTSLVPPSAQSSVYSTSPLVERSAPSKLISGPTNGTVISDLSAWGNQPDKHKDHKSEKEQKEAKALKKRSIWGFRGRSSSDLTNEQKPESNKMPPGRMVFGVSLEEAISVSRPFGVTAPLPAVVYRCIEYLDAKNAVNEEGIFRLSGSNVVIKGLRDRFNSESDVNLLAAEEYYDVHAVAGLLKLYLRELPTNILTSERREDFLRVTEMEDKHKKIIALNELVHRLPIENFTLLQALSGHLIRIIDNAAVNKMTVRNVGIVFSPTLNIPAQVFALFLQEHHDIFGEEREQDYSSEEHHQQQQNDTNLLTPHQNEKLRQPSFTNQERPNLEPPRSATLPLSPSFKPTYDIPHYDRPHPHYSQGNQGNPHRTSYLPPDPNQQQNPTQQQMQEQFQKQQNAVTSNQNQFGQDSPGGLDVKSAKARRRESSMMMGVLGIGGGMRKSILSPRPPQSTVGMVVEDDLY